MCGWFPIDICIIIHSYVDSIIPFISENQSVITLVGVRVKFEICEDKREKRYVR